MWATNGRPYGVGIGAVRDFSFSLPPSLRDTSLVRGRQGGAPRTSPPTGLDWVRREARRGAEDVAPYVVGLGAVQGMENIMLFLSE